MNALSSKLPPRELWLLNEALIMGGGGSTTLRLAAFATSVSPRPYEVRLLTPKEGALAQRAHDAGLDVVSLELPPLTPSAVFPIGRIMSRLRKEIGASSPDALFVGVTPRSHAYLAAASALIHPKRANVQLLLEQETASRRSARLVYRRVGGLVALGENTMRTYARALPGVPIEVANNVLTSEEFEQAAALEAKARETPPVLGFLARLIPEKGLLELLEELAVARDTWRSLLVAGPPQDLEYVQRLERRVAALGLEQAVSFLGFADASSFLGGIDALVVPSTGTEGQPTVIIEALAHGVPVIVREAVWSRDFEGLPVLPYASVDELTRAISHLPTERVDSTRLIRRFGPAQLLGAIEKAADPSARS
jgi:glycosyltransferase involved in cell wall biosynthesis